MDRIALAAIASGLVLILATIGTVVTGDGLPMLTALGATLSGGIIVSGLAVLERRAASPLSAA